ncbi:MAG: aldose 1-epimerase family protein [Spirochaetota bacterium]
MSEISILRSQAFEAVVASKGAELKSLRSRRTGQEFLWNGDPEWWGGSAPVLFPVIGGLRGGHYTFQGESYSLGSHGFARRSEFQIVDRTPDSVTLFLGSSEATSKSYPFDFRLTVGYLIDYAGVTATFTVENSGYGQMLFSIGWHPAFLVPFAGGPIEHYFLEFSDLEEDERVYFGGGLLLDQVGSVFDNSRHIFLHRRLFDDAAIILPRLQSSEVIIRKSRAERRITIGTGGASSLAIWAPPGGAPFVCVEPWFGLPDYAFHAGDLTEKEGILSLEPGGVFAARFPVVID